MTSKQKLFVQYYLDQNAPDTYCNAYNSAVKAGFEKSTAYAASTKILNKDCIKQEIKAHQEEKRLIGSITLEEKKSIAWQNYLEAKKEGTLEAARKWFREHGELAGHYITKSEIDQKVSVQQMTEEENKLINEAIRKNRLAGVN